MGIWKARAEARCWPPAPASKVSGAYVAIARITGKLRGLEGSFVLQHSGTMNNGELHLLITVGPDSGTGELVGITGQMTITIADGKHSYQFEYTLPAMLAEYCRTGHRTLLIRTQRAQRTRKSARRTQLGIAGDSRPTAARQLRRTQSQFAALSRFQFQFV